MIRLCFFQEDDGSCEYGYDCNTGECLDLDSNGECDFSEGSVDIVIWAQ